VITLRGLTHLSSDFPFSRVIEEGYYESRFSGRIMLLFY